MTAVAVAALAAVAAAGHVGYPLWLWLVTRSRQPPVPPPPPASWPGVTAVVAAYREAAVIGAKVADLATNGYPGELEILVVADDAETAVAARAAGARVIESPVRRGKCAALNLGFDAAGHDVIVLSDANAMLAPGSLAAMVRWFADESVGAVAGEKHGDGAATGEGFFWRFESWLKQREWRAGTTIGLVGELAAVRRRSFPVLPTDIVVDDLWIALHVSERGERVAYEPAASTSEEIETTLAADWERRTRNVAGAIDVLWRRRSMLAIGQPLAMQLWGHRLARFTTGPTAHTALLALALVTPRRTISRAFLAGHVAAALGLWRTRSGRASTPERVLGQVLWLQAVAIGGLVRHLRGDRPAMWPKPERR